jgi:uncharacterized protein with GYD domain
MAKYLAKASYTAQGTKGLLKDGGSRRRAAVKNTVRRLGGRLEAFYYTFGDSDAIIILDLPDAASAAALSMATAASGAVRISTTPLITPEDIDKACRKHVTYKAPGS